MFVFLTCLPVFLLKFRLGDLIGCGIKFYIQRAHTWHTLEGPLHPENKKYQKKHDDEWGLSKVCQVDTRWMQNLIMHPTSSPNQILSKNTRRYVKNTNKKVVFFFSSSKINKYYFIILLFSLGCPFWVEISSNSCASLHHLREVGLIFSPTYITNWMI